LTRHDPEADSRHGTRHGATLTYDTAGTGPSVMLSGGGGTLDRRMWDAQVATPAHRYTGVRYDDRGIDQSSRPEGGAELAGIESAGQLLNIDAPEQFTTLLQFLATSL
jgi:pimeloyl-ACP methyl ester carboxylesterase